MSNLAEVPAEIAALSFEDALAELERSVRELEAGTTKLDDSIAAYERGSHLKLHCERKLREAPEKVERISKSSDGKIGAGPAGLDWGRRMYRMSACNGACGGELPAEGRRAVAAWNRREKSQEAGV